jgi:hypothetical protein
MSETPTETTPMTQEKTKTITVFVNNNPIDLPDREESGAEIKQAAGLPLEFTLYDPKGRAVSNGEEIRVHRNEKFTAISGQDVS